MEKKMETTRINPKCFHSIWEHLPGHLVDGGHLRSFSVKHQMPKGIREVAGIPEP